MSKLSTIRFNNRYFNNLIIGVVTETIFGNIATLIRERCILGRGVLFHVKQPIDIISDYSFVRDYRTRNYGETTKREVKTIINAK